MLKKEIVLNFLILFLVIAVTVIAFNFYRSPESEELVEKVQDFEKQVVMYGEAETQKPNGKVNIKLSDVEYSSPTYKKERGKDINNIIVVLKKVDPMKEEYDFKKGEDKIDATKYERYLNTLDSKQKVTVNFTGWDNPKTFCEEYTCNQSFEGKNGEYVKIKTIFTEDERKVGIYPIEKSGIPFLERLRRAFYIFYEAL